MTKVKVKKIIFPYTIINYIAFGRRPNNYSMAGWYSFCLIKNAQQCAKDKEEICKRGEIENIFL